MNLFTKEKEMVLKLVNGILVIWLIAATVISFSNLIYVVIPEEKPIYEKYAQKHCYSKEDDEDSCKQDFLFTVEYYEDNIRNNKQYLAVAVFNILVVGTSLFILNPKKKKTK